MATQSPNLKTIHKEYAENLKQVQRRVIVCAGTGCVANGSLKVYDQLAKELTVCGLTVTLELHHEAKPAAKSTYISKSGCQGFCQMGPLVTILPENIFYTRVKPSDVEEIVHKTLVKGEVIQRLLYDDPATGKACKTQSDIPFYQKQKRFVLVLRKV